ncbi:MAG: tRNA lysidine(34) synthetase TilS [Candidatus Fermentibacteraceae bacterium]|nr:tRNA lysidine(34) synthetase TilS [Candidatus Fermentibacteraceae bacterium]MBN2609360.1 tRNA lysidine(34) synthetase TilS [Candidatus Fermentibacteraceae bacterium]
MNCCSDVEKSFIETVRTRDLLPEGCRVVAAVSGGSDSVALLRLLLCFRSHMRWDLEVLHVDHGARPESRRDAEFVRSLAQRAALPFVLHRITPPETGSVEDHFSRERQRIYASCCEKVALAATGHTADDRAETLVMRLLEGAGLRGLGGMDFIGEGPVRRPLLEITRTRLREYLVEIGQNWLEDPTNSEDEFLRNRIRHDIMPALESISPGSATAIARSSANLSQWRDMVDCIVRDSLDEMLQGDTFHRRRYGDLPEAVRLAVLWTLAGRPRGGRLELEKTDRWILSGRDGFHMLPGGARIVMDGDLGRVDGIQSTEDERNRLAKR